MDIFLGLISSWTRLLLLESGRIVMDSTALTFGSWIRCSPLGPAYLSCLLLNHVAWSQLLPGPQSWSAINSLKEVQLRRELKRVPADTADVVDIFFLSPSHEHSQGLNMMSIRYRPLQNGVGDPNEATLQLWSRHGNQLSAGFVLGRDALFGSQDSHKSCR
ncbi:hypothetical protein KC347_g226 [Hortaea werneckii]|nr:hypothetical protein KC347_g226 [Hortaea werneckii]